MKKVVLLSLVSFCILYITNAQINPDQIWKLSQIASYRKWNDSVPGARKAEWIQLGNYKWALKDLEVTSFRNGDSIPRVSKFEFVALTAKNQPAMMAWSEGKDEQPYFLYNAAAAKDKRGLAPAGYRIAGYNEWEDLIKYGGGDTVAGEFLFGIGFNNLGSINSYGDNNQFIDMWLVDDSKVSEYDPVFVLTQALNYKVNLSAVPLGSGFPIRCVKIETTPGVRKIAGLPKAKNPVIVTGEITDNEGNKYKTITVNSQTWMAENLKSTKFKDGSPITNASVDTVWKKTSGPAYCKIYNNPEKYGFYGQMYNWLSVGTGKLCPAGWHVPSDAEWDKLLDVFGGASLAGDYLKLPDKNLWLPSNYKPSNVNANNLSEFTVLPAGLRYTSGTFNSQNFDGYFWSSDVKGKEASAWHFGTRTDVNNFSSSKETGMSVRCIKNTK